MLYSYGSGVYENNDPPTIMSMKRGHWVQSTNQQMNYRWNHGFILFVSCLFLLNYFYEIINFLL